MPDSIATPPLQLAIRPNGRHEACRFTVGQHLSAPGRPLAEAGQRVLCVVDAAVASYADRLVAEGWFGRAEVTRLELEEPKKNLATAQRIWELSTTARTDLSVAVGGGTVCDLVGFTASCLYRGSPMVFFPTTTLAMMDATVSGKTGLDFGGLKNLLGSIHYPREVYCQTEVLGSLPQRHLVSGFAESVKIAVTSSQAFFESLEDWGRKGGPLCGEIMPVVLESCRLKSILVAGSPEVRKHSLYGHVIGHALESLVGPGALHGECVSLGLLCEGWLAVRRGYWREEDWHRQFAVLGALGLPVRPLRALSSEAVLDQARRDKYCRDGQLMLVLPGGIGQVHAPDGRAWTPVPLKEARGAYAEMFELLEGLV